MTSDAPAILLVQSYLGPTEPPVMPLGLARLAAVLPGWRVEVLDLNLHADPAGALREALKRLAPAVVGVSLRNIDSTNKRRVTYYYAHLGPTLRLIKEEAPRARIVLGGAAFSMYAEAVMAREPLAELGVFLEGEATLPALLGNLERPWEVPGVYYRDGGRVVLSGPPAPVDLAQLPPPRWDLLDLAAYAVEPIGVGVETKRGCALGCAYCPYPFLNGRRYRPQDPARVAEEVAALTARGVRRYTFVDSIFNLPLDHARAVCEALVARGLATPWSAWFHESHLDPGFIALAQRAGCDNFILSPDGFSDAAMQSLGKQQRLAEVLAAHEMLKAAGARVSYNFFKNPPGQTPGAALGLVKFMLRAKRELGRRVSFELNSIRIEPHTRLEALARREGLITRDDDLLTPRYYTNPGTAWIEAGFNLLLRLWGK